MEPVLDELRADVLDAHPGHLARQLDDDPVQHPVELHEQHAGRLERARRNAFLIKAGDRRLPCAGVVRLVAGQLFHTTTPVVTWMDPGGYDAYRVERRFAPLDKASWKDSEGGDLNSPNRYGSRARGLSPEVASRQPDARSRVARGE